MNYYQLRKLNLFETQTIEESVVKQKRPISIFYGNFPIIEWRNEIWDLGSNPVECGGKDWGSSF